MTRSAATEPVPVPASTAAAVSRLHAHPPMSSAPIHTVQPVTWLAADTRSEPMPATVLYMSMSLDGFIAGPNVSPDNGLGDGGVRLHEWPFPGPDGGVNQKICDEFMSTGAIVAGRGTFEPADGWGGDHHDGVPIYILSRHPAPDWVAAWPNVHYVSDLEVAVRDAKQAAGDKNVLVHGSSITQRMLTTGLLDEMEIHLIPVLLGDGVRLFEHLGVEHRELERIRVVEGEGGVTHLRYRVRR
jgi:dihydrofolate reductase